jgi:hypothetical protein
MKKVDRQINHQSQSKLWQLKKRYHIRIRRVQLLLATAGGSSILFGAILTLQTTTHLAFGMDFADLVRIVHSLGLLMVTLSVLPLARWFRR